LQKERGRREEEREEEKRRGRRERREEAGGSGGAVKAVQGANAEKELLNGGSNFGVLDEDEVRNGLVKESDVTLELFVLKLFDALHREQKGRDLGLDVFGGHTGGICVDAQIILEQL